MVAAAWAEAHASLLAAAIPSLRSDEHGGSRNATMHVFTATPKASRRLLETSVRLHAIGAVGAEWFSVELN